MFYDLKNEGDGVVNMHSTDAGVKFVMNPGETVVVSGVQAAGLKLFADDPLMKMTLSPSKAKEMSPKAAVYVVDQVEAIANVARTSQVKMDSHMMRPENRGMFTGAIASDMPADLSKREKLQYLDKEIHELDTEKQLEEKAKELEVKKAERVKLDAKKAEELAKEAAKNPAPPATQKTVGPGAQGNPGPGPELSPNK